jgi:C4-dicarboxylate transporter DctM subunit
MPAIILGGIVSGVFTATEAGCVAAVYSAFVGIFVYRELKLRDLEEVFVRTAATTSMVMLILASCSIFSWILAIKQFPAFVSELLLVVSSNPAVVIAMVMVVLVIVGLFMETLAAAIILIPVLEPICTQFGFDPIHFAVVVVMTFILGTITPPVGVLLYITTAIAEEDLARVARKIIIPALIVAGVCVLAAYYPPVVTAIPNLFFK